MRLDEQHEQTLFCTHTSSPRYAGMPPSHPLSGGVEGAVPDG